MVRRSTLPSGSQVAGAAVAGDGQRRLQDIQGLRGIAVLLVVLYHAGLPVNGGFVGVDVFFVISGFVITRMLMGEIRRSGRISLGAFFGRRILRLLPALAVVTVVTLVVAGFVQSPIGAQQDTAIVGVGASTWSANAALYFVTGDYFDNAADTIPLLHIWSLAVEEQFYVVFPLVVLVVAMFTPGQRAGCKRMTWALSVIGLFSLMLSIWLTYGTVSGLVKPATAAFYSSPTRAWEFIAGALVALWAISRKRGGGRSSAAGVVSVLGGAGLIVSGLCITSHVSWPGYAALLPVMSTSALIVAGQLDPGTCIGRVLEWRPLTWLGDLSYSWYLWHWPFIVFATALKPTAVAPVVAATASLAVAWLSYERLEQPLRRWRPAKGRSIVALTAVCIVVPLTLSGTLWTGAQRSWGQPALQEMASQLRPVPMGYGLGCHSSTPLGDRDLARCTFGDPGGDVVYLLGDSNGGQYAEAVVASTEKSGQRAILGTMSGCPFIDIDFVDVAGCRNFYENSLSWLSQQPSATILLGSANEAVTDPSVWLQDPLDGAVASATRDKARLWQEALERTIAALRDAGHDVVVIETMPKLGDDAFHGNWWNPSRCPLLTVTRDPSSCNARVSLDAEGKRQAPALQAERAASEESGARILSVRNFLCPEGECSALDNGRWVYRDGLHISTSTSRRMAPLFETALVSRT